MSIENAVRNRDVLLTTVGRQVLNTMYPDEFEMYICALELLDKQGATLRYFIFPVNPTQMTESQPKLTNVKKAAAGVVSLSTTTFVPVDINIAGNFGRRFKILLGADYVDFIQSFQSFDGQISASSLHSGTVGVFDERTKTGYGCVKILEDIVHEADVVDENGPRRLIFYNLAFGTSYLVKPMAFNLNMAQETNMLHGYTLSLKGIAPIESLRSPKDIDDEAKRLNTTAYIQKQTDRAVQSLTSLLTKS